MGLTGLITDAWGVTLAPPTGDLATGACADAHRDLGHACYASWNAMSFAQPWKVNGIQHYALFAGYETRTLHQRIAYDTRTNPAQLFASGMESLSKRIRKHLVDDPRHGAEIWLPNLNTSMNFIGNSSPNTPRSWTAWKDVLRKTHVAPFHEKFNVGTRGSGSGRLQYLISQYATRESSKRALPTVR